MGYHRAGFGVAGVDIKPQPRYPFEFIQVDAMTFPLGGFDVIHASPPCQAYMDTNANGKKFSNHPRLIEPLRDKLSENGKPFIIENVHKAPLKQTVMLCGTMFNLRIIRHRYFECSFPLFMSPFVCNHWGEVASGDFIGVYARGGRGHRRGKGFRDGPPDKAKTTPEEAMGIDWMSKVELTQAIPPAYTEWIGKQLMRWLDNHQAQN